VARALIAACGRPIAAPSANRSGRPSPTRAEHVREDLDGRVELILDGGPTPVGVESTVLDMTTDPPMLLRPGGVTLEELQDCLGGLRVLRSDDDSAAGRSPGLRYRHYAPRAQVIIIEAGTGERVVAPWVDAGRPVALMTQRPLSLERPGLTVRTMPGDLGAYARDLFAVLRELDSTGVEGIFVEAVPWEGLGLTIMDRLRRAASS
jgi:L-threonylcarbamoyladenylate synthase